MLFNNLGNEKSKYSNGIQALEVYLTLVSIWCDIVDRCEFVWPERCRLFWVIWSSDEACTVDALAARGDEGRCSLRKASGSRQTDFDPEMSEWGNPPLGVSCTEYIGAGGEPGELKHLSNQRKRNQLRFPQ